MTNIEWLSVFLISFLNIKLHFSPLDGFLSAGRTGQTKTMVNNQKNMDSATIYRVTGIKCGKYF